jgi:hypothetical protein
LRSLSLPAASLSLALGICRQNARRCATDAHRAPGTPRVAPIPN